MSENNKKDIVMYDGTVGCSFEVLVMILKSIPTIEFDRYCAKVYPMLTPQQAYKFLNADFNV